MSAVDNRLVFFFGVLGASVYFVLEAMDSEWQTISKPLPTLVLLWFQTRRQIERVHSYANSIQIATLVCAVADVVIESSFVGGLWVFFIAHLIYSRAFLLVSTRLHIEFLLPIAALTGFIFSSLHQKIPADMILPVSLYVTAISLAAWRAFAAARAIKSCGLVVASLLFIISDSMIGAKVFHVLAIPYVDLLIGSTYLLSLYMFDQSVLDVAIHAQETSKKDA